MKLIMEQNDSDNVTYNDGGTQNIIDETKNEAKEDTIEFSQLLSKGVTLNGNTSRDDA